MPVSSLEETAASQPGYECCTFRGSLVALDASTGEIVWQTYTVPAPQSIGKNPAGSTLLGAIRRRRLVVRRRSMTKRDVVYISDRQHVQRARRSRPPTRSSRSI